VKAVQGPLQEEGRVGVRVRPDQSAGLLCVRGAAGDDGDAAYGDGGALRLNLLPIHSNGGAIALLRLLLRRPVPAGDAPQVDLLRLPLRGLEGADGVSDILPGQCCPVPDPHLLDGSSAFIPVHGFIALRHPAHLPGHTGPLVRHHAFRHGQQGLGV
ncbi:8-oxo-dGTP diphosphatase, partial [Dysosmobacter welbionis]